MKFAVTLLAILASVAAVAATPTPTVELELRGSCCNCPDGSSGCGGFCFQNPTCTPT